MITLLPPPVPARLRTLPDPEEMFQALLSRDASYDGIFFVGVRTTGVFCRPTCHAKKPLRKNVTFHATAADAVHAGYRPCRMCHPAESAGGVLEPWMASLLTRIDRRPEQRITDNDLRELSLDPARVRRRFKQRYGMTFHAYQRATRLGRALRDAQEHRGKCAQLALRSGYESESGFRDAFSKYYGEPPRRAEAIEPLIMQRIHTTPLGPMIAIASDHGVCLLEFCDRRGLERELESLRRRRAAAIVPGRNEQLETLTAQLQEYFAGERKQFSVRIDTRGTPWQERVWRRLRDIPYGRTASYSEVAADLDRLGAQRAVGRANGQNCIAIVTPCHRVVRADGALCGYGGGVWRKQWLLELERACA